MQFCNIDNLYFKGLETHWNITKVMHERKYIQLLLNQELSCCVITVQIKNQCSVMLWFGPGQRLDTCSQALKK